MISTKSKYGLMAMLELASQFQTGPTQAKSIAERHQLPLSYLEQLLAELKKNGLVVSFRGAQGGYALSKSPEEITVYQIVTLLEGDTKLSEGHKGCLGLESFWKEMDAKIVALFNITLAQLLANKQREEKTLTFTI
jgi:Rrf2 family cysteine metabolism transcriptional repressor